MNKDVLIVDDEKGILELLGHIARDQGWEPYTAQDAVGALQQFNGVRPPIVITDLRLGDGIGGVNLMKEIKNIDPLTIVVAMSGLYDSSYTVSNLRRAGFDHLVTKPVTIKTMQQILTHCGTCRSGWEDIQAGG